MPRENVNAREETDTIIEHYVLRDNFSGDIRSTHFLGKLAVWDSVLTGRA